MSRIDEAWKRVSGPVPHSWENAARAERLEDPDEGVLDHYPQEGGLAGVSAKAPDRLPHRTIVAPRTGDHRQLGPLDVEFERKLVVSKKASAIAVEQYRRLAGAVHDLQVEQGLKTLMVTSALPHEGKTLTVANLALTLSEACSRRVLLIDADLRRPFVHEVFRLPNARGLSDVLRSERGEMPLLQVSDHLTVLPAGKLDQPMALTSDRMRVLLEQCAATYDWVLIDAAPVGFMPDAQLLARLTRAVLFVIAAHSTPHLLVSRAIAELGPECVVGTVLNRVEEHNIPAAAYYHDYYSHDRQGD
jgi:capsular exopolysaccharide synthesis family protein